MDSLWRPTRRSISSSIRDCNDNLNFAESSTKKLTLNTPVNKAHAVHHFAEHKSEGIYIIVNLKTTAVQLLPHAVLLRSQQRSNFKWLTPYIPESCNAVCFQQLLNVHNVLEMFFRKLRTSCCRSVKALVLSIGKTALSKSNAYDMKKGCLLVLLQFTEATVIPVTFVSMRICRLQP